MIKKTICTLGVWDDTVPGISFDKEGISNFARLQIKLMESYPRGQKGLNDWRLILAEIKRKKKSKYDCIVGVSGGVDSSYLLYLLKIKYELNPLAVTLDNGWSTSIAVENIKKMTTALGVDLETYVIDYEEIKDLMRAYMYAGLPWIDIATDTAIKSVMYTYALSEKVKYIFRGNDFRSEGKQPRPWTYGDNLQLKFIHKKFGQIKKLKTFPYLSFYKIIYAGFIRGVKDIRPYYYLDYSKSSAKAFLQEVYGWQDYGGHHHENSFTKFVMSIWLPDKFGIDKRIINLSAQVLSGSISYDEAIKLLNVPALCEKEKEDLTAYVIKKLDLTKVEYNRILAAPCKSYRDYPNYEKLLFTILRHFKPFIRLVYKQMPMTFVEMEMNSEKR